MAEITLYPYDDSSLSSTSPDSNYGLGDGGAIGAVYAGGDKAVLMRLIGRFNVTPVQNSTLVSAKLVLSTTTFLGSGRAGTVHRITNPTTYVELEVTWNDEYLDSPWATYGGEYTTPPPGVGFTMPGGAGDWEIPGMLAFVTDAIASRSNIVTVILRLDDESPGASQYVANEAWRLVVTDTSVGAGREQHDHIQIM